MVDKISIFRSYDLLIEEFVKWAEPWPDIRAAMIIGTRARQDRPADEWADLDMVIVTTNPGQYVSTTDWVKNMGNPLLTFMEPTAEVTKTNAVSSTKACLTSTSPSFQSRK
jgi:hypothetical protein